MFKWIVPILFCWSHVHPHPSNSARQNETVPVSVVSPRSINCNQIGFQYHPEDKTKYVRCIYLTSSKQWFAYVYTCPNGSEFDVDFEACVTGNGEKPNPCEERVRRNMLKSHIVRGVNSQSIQKSNDDAEIICP